MQDITTKSPTSSDKEPTLRDLYDRMGPRNGIAGRVVAQLAAEGVSVAVSTVFNVTSTAAPATPQLRKPS